MTATAAATLLPGFAGTTLPDWVARRLGGGLAGVCLFGDNIATPRQLRELTDAIVDANPHAIIALDEEGGDVTRLYYKTGAPTPGNAWLGRHGDVGRTKEAAATIARQLREVGCNLNLAPTADVNSKPRNPVIGVRSFSADAGVAAGHTAAWVSGHQAEGVAVSVKHFPGHGDTQTDSHLALPVVDADRDTLAVRDLPPFQAAIDVDAWSVMTSHILLPHLDPDRPATFSAPVLQTLLRDRLGFRGVVVSDALDMAGASAETGIPEAAVRALEGGCDLLCIGSNNSDAQLSEIEAAIDAAVEAGRLPVDRLADAARRVARLGARLADRRVPAAALGEHFDDAPTLALDVVSSVFETSDAGAARLARLAAHGRPPVVVQLETTPNNAVGVAPWGPGASRPVVRMSEGGTVGPVLADAGGSPVVLVGRDNHRHRWVRALVDTTRARREDVLVVDMGWPDETRAYADLATFGGSRLLGEALMELLTAAHQVRPS